MSAIWAFLNDTAKLRKALIIYWCVVPAAFIAYALLTAGKLGLDFRAFLADPTIALTFIICCMMPIQVALLLLARRCNEHTEKAFAIFAGVQQLVVGNVLGALLSYFLARSLWWAPREPLGRPHRAVMLGGTALIGFLTLLTAVIGLRVLAT